MTKQKQQDVHQRLLSAGLRLFAEKGYERATVREICDVAESNLASINYYFRDKAGYYAEVTNYAHSLRMAELNKLLSAHNTTDPWEMLSLHIDTLLGNAYNSEIFLSAWLCLREFMDKDPSHSDSYSTQVRKSQLDFESHIRSLLAQLLGEAATEENVVLLHYTYTSLSLFLVLETGIGANSPSNLKIMPKVTREQLLQHILGTVKNCVDKMKREYAEQPRMEK